MQLLAYFTRYFLTSLFDLGIKHPSYSCFDNNLTLIYYYFTLKEEEEVQKKQEQRPGRSCININ